MSRARIPTLKQKSRSLARLDRLPWAAGKSLIAFGVRIGVRASTSALLEQVFPFLPAGWKAASSLAVDRLYSLCHDADASRPKPAGSYVLYGDTRTLVKTNDPRLLIDTLEHNLNFHVAKMSPHLFFVHSGVIGWKGRAVVFPGGSFSGKSALAKEFLLLGAEYYSDEFAVFDSHGHVHAFPRRLCIRDENRRQTMVHVSALGAKVGTRPLPMAILVMTRYKRGATFRPKITTEGEALLELLGNSLSARRYPEQALTVFEKAVRGALVLDGIRGDAKVTAESILGILDRLR